MLDLLADRIKKRPSRQAKLHTVREFLQILILKIMAQHHAFTSLAFLGGAALRILHGVRRYSEDLDFSVYSSQAYHFDKLLHHIRRELELHNFIIGLKYKRGVVDNCFVSFSGLLQELGLGVAKDQKLSIKIEVDTNPPSGAKIEESIVHEEFIFGVKNYDIESLMAGKLHAILCRRFWKGRDFYDLLWYLTKKIRPNTPLLNNAVKQTEGENPKITSKNWEEILLTKLKKVDFRKVQQDVQNFLFDKDEAGVLTLQNFQRLL